MHKYLIPDLLLKTINYSNSCNAIIKILSLSITNLAAIHLSTVPVEHVCETMRVRGYFIG